MNKTLIALAFMLPAAAMAQTATIVPKSALATGLLTRPGTPVSNDADLSTSFATKADSPRLDAEIARALAVEAGLLPKGAPILVTAVPPQNLTYAAGGLANGILITPGNATSYCPVLSCPTSPSADHQRASVVIWGTTQDDGHSEEQTLAVETIINKGAFRLWSPGVSYAVGDVLKQGAINSVYRAIQAGTSATSGTGPAGKSSTIADGTVVWQWINDAAILGKVGTYSETAVYPGAGNAWDSAHNFELRPGSVIPDAFLVNSELDFSNNSGTDCAAGVNSCVALQIFMGGTNASTAAIAIAPNGIIPTVAKTSIFGIFLNGQVASLSDIELDGSSAVYGLSFGNFVPGGAYKVSSISDKSNSPHSYQIQGTRTLSSIDDTSTAPAALTLSGTYSIGAISTQSATTTAALITAPGQQVCWAGGGGMCASADTNGKFVVINNGTRLMSLDGSGNLTIKGALSQSALP